MTQVPFNAKPSKPRPLMVQRVLRFVVLLVVVLALVLAVLVFGFNLLAPPSGNTPWGRAQVEMGEIVKALNTYHMNHGRAYPADLDAVSDQFRDGVPLNPFTKLPYIYEPKSDGFTLTCFGKDDARGGKKPPDMDIVFTERGLQANP